LSNILWLASYPKSGNTWIRAFLANLIANRDQPVPLNELSRYCDDESLPERYSKLGGRSHQLMSVAELCALRTGVHAEIARAAPGTRFVKTHNRSGSFDGHPLHNASVSVGAVYVVRNPLDVAISMSHHFSLSLDEAIERLAAEQLATATDALFVSQILGSWSQHVASWADHVNERIVVLRYEDLLLKPGKSFMKVARLVGLDKDAARIDRAIRHSSFGSLASIETRDGFVEAAAKDRRFFRVGRANQWRGVLSSAQIERIVKDHRQQMARFRYLPGGR
jgi:hypothetical protein